MGRERRGTGGGGTGREWDGSGGTEAEVQVFRELSGYTRSRIVKTRKRVRPFCESRS